MLNLSLMGIGVKGTQGNPYTMAEFEELADAGLWQGGYVIDDGGTVSYMMAELTVVGYSGYSGYGSSGSDSWDPWGSDGEGSNPWDDGSIIDDGDGTGGGNTGGIGTGGNTGGIGTGGNTGGGGTSGGGGGNHGGNNNGNGQNCPNLPSIEDVVKTLPEPAQEFYEYLKRNGKVSVSFDNERNTPGNCNSKTGEIKLTYDPQYPGEASWYTTELTHELGHLYQRELGFIEKFNLDSPIEFQSNTMDFISGNSDYSDFLRSSMNGFKNWLNSIKDENGIDLNEFEDGISDWYDDFVNAHLGEQNNYSDDEDYLFQDDIKDMNWEDMFDFYGVKYHR